jgi:transposase
MPKSHPPYPAGYRQQRVDLVRAGRAPGALAGECEVSAQAIRNWVRQGEWDAGQRRDGLTSVERGELQRLHRENKQLRLERQILTRAAAWFARERNAVPERSSDS